MWSVMLILFPCVHYHFRPIFQAHVVDSDESDEEGENSNAKVSEVDETDRPDLKHQPEIVESPDKMAGTSNPTPTTQSKPPAQVEVRPSTEGSGAAKQEKNDQMQVDA